MGNIIKLMLILIEVGQSLVSAKKNKEFESNVEKIKTDPVNYARVKFGRVRAVPKDSERVPNSDSDHHY